MATKRRSNGITRLIDNVVDDAIGVRRNGRRWDGRTRVRSQRDAGGSQLPRVSVIIEAEVPAGHE